MKTYLISQEQIKQFAVFLMVAMLAVFFAGYYLGGGLGGGQKSAISSAGESLSAAPDGTEQAEINTSTLLQAQPGSANEAGNVKPDGAQKAQRAESGTKATSVSNKKKAEQKAADKNKADKKQADKKRVERQKAEQAKAAKKLADKKRADAKPAAMKAQKARAQKEAAQKDQAQKAQSKAQLKKTAEKQAAGSTGAGTQAKAGKAASSQSPQRSYSIQAGMFASKVNARSFIDKLAEKNFKAYVSNFVSTSGAVKYNVRVGRFEQRDQARVLLRKFQQSFSSPAYVVISDEKAR
ncbi:hypothetical protein MNBD_GAMMA10-2294 [hydrothermal vent metagenome]|uniref:SPOR domain-containing protein n=1 Tax=hydrothermal vent metagenome TaxID=652676 RepID=A0A3B0YH71_9ZZZZ